MDIEPNIIIAGCGPGDKSYIPEHTICAVQTAEILAGAENLIKLFPNFDKQKILFEKSTNNFTAQIFNHQSKKIVVLVSGDPGFHSLARFVINAIGVEKCMVLPAISALQLAAARLKIFWHDAVINSVHKGIEPDFEKIKQTEKMFLLLGNDISWVSALVICLEHTHRVYICSDLSFDSERVMLLNAETKINAKQKNILVVMRK